MASLSLIHVSSLPPTACGVAEYTAALAHQIHVQAPEIAPFFVRVDCEAQGSGQTERRIDIAPADGAAIAKAAQVVNGIERKVVLLQHEFKLYGGADGENVGRFLNALKAPVITTLHTVWPSFPPIRHRVFVHVLRCSRFVVVFSKRSAQILVEGYGIEAEKVRVIPHGVPDVPFRTPSEVEWPGLPPCRVKFISSGLVRPAKGIEHVINALGALKAVFQDFALVVCGADHPRNPGAAEYRGQLMALVARLGLEDNVVFLNRFLEWREMVSVIQACDVGVLAYTSREQSSSGVLALMLACGRPVVATDFQYAVASLNGDNGVIVPMGDVRALAAALELIAKDVNRRERMMLNSYNSTRHWLWREVAREHLDIVHGMDTAGKSGIGGLFSRPAGA